MSIKKFNLILFMLSFGWIGNALAQTVRMSGQINYPKTFNGLSIFQGNRAPLLPDYILYIFTFAIMVSGLVILWVIVSAGFEWYVSAGNAGKVKDSKDRIFSAFVGIIILFLSWLILQTINPSLTTMELTTGAAGITISNSMGDKILAPYYVRDLTTLDPPANIISVPFVRVRETKIFLFPKSNFTGDPKEIEYNWDCPGKIGDDVTKMECFLPIPEGYEKGSLITYELKTGVYIYKKVGGANSKAIIPFYISGDVSNIDTMNDYSSIPGKVLGFRIYNSEPNNNRRTVVVVWSEKNYSGYGAVFSLPNIEGFSPPNGIATMPWYDVTTQEQVSGNWQIPENQKNVKSLKILQVGSRGEPAIDVFSEAEYFPDNQCALKDISNDGDKTLKQQFLEIDCSQTSNNFPMSIRARNGVAVVISQYIDGKNTDPEIFGFEGRHRSDGWVTSFTKGEIFKGGGDPNLNDNREIGQCVCSNRNWWTIGIACAIWQSCGTHILAFPPI